MAKKRQKKKEARNLARKLAKSPRMTVEYLMKTYTKSQLMRIFRYQMINKVTVLSLIDVDMVMGLDEDDPLIKRPDIDLEPAVEPAIDPKLQVKL